MKTVLPRKVVTTVSGGAELHLKPKAFCIENITSFEQPGTQFSGRTLTDCRYLKYGCGNYDCLTTPLRQSGKGKMNLHCMFSRLRFSESVT